MPIFGQNSISRTEVPSLKSLSLLRTVYLLQIMILTISGGGNVVFWTILVPNQAKSWSVVDRMFWVGLNSLEMDI